MFIDMSNLNFDESWVDSAIFIPKLKLLFLKTYIWTTEWYKNKTILVYRCFKIIIGVRNIGKFGKMPNLWKLQNYAYLAVTVIMNTFAEVLKKSLACLCKATYDLLKVEINWMEKMRYEGQGHTQWTIRRHLNVTMTFSGKTCLRRDRHPKSVTFWKRPEPLNFIFKTCRRLNKNPTWTRYCNVLFSVRDVFVTPYLPWNIANM